jgi:hypothetical protein
MNQNDRKRKNDKNDTIYFKCMKFVIFLVKIRLSKAYAISYGEA